MTHAQTNRRLPNYLRTHRRKVGLTQRELGLVLGYGDEGTVSKHEKFDATPPLEIAIGYGIVFRVPLSELFAGLRDEVGGEIEGRLAELEEHLGRQSVRDRNAIAIARKLMWLSERKSAEYEPIQ
jgi:DNA-binding XRE family transcriptional regulator